MFHKFSKQHFHNTMHKHKSFLGHAYHHTKSVLGNMDHGAKIAKKAYAIMEPIISQYAGNKVHHNVMKAVSGYDDIRHKIICGHNQIEDHVNNVSSKFKKAGLNIGI